jgi:hypothetical protein
MPEGRPYRDSPISVVARSIILKELSPMDKCSVKKERRPNESNDWGNVCGGKVHNDLLGGGIKSDGR